MSVIGLDIGRSAVKAYTGASMFSFPSVIGEWRERRLHTDYGDKAFDVEFRGERYFAGTLAQHESEFARSMMTDDKAHEDTLILALIAIHRAGLTEAAVVTGLPVESHNDENKRKMRELLIGRHDITVNGTRRIIVISRVEVAVEGGAAFWSAPCDGLVRIIDAGSKTVNFVTMRDKRYVDRESSTLPFGFDTNKSTNYAEMAKRIAGELGRKWSANDNVITSGGKAEQLARLITPYFPNAYPISNPLYANAIGYYRAGRRL